MSIGEINLKIKELEGKINDPDLCKNTASVYARISGYYRPLKNWNEGKASEFASRKNFLIG
jgi:ribonucleoside-triphosphate reductase